MRISLSLSIAAAVSFCGCSSDAHDARTQLDLPGDTFYPQAIAASADGTLFVAGLVNAPIVKFAPDSAEVEVMVPAQPPYAFPALYADDSTKTLYACAGKFDGPGFSNPETELRAYDFSGNLQRAYPLPKGSLCEEIAIDAKHRIYVADSFGASIFVLSDSGAQMTPWIHDDRLQAIPPPAGVGFGVHSLAFDGDTYLYFDNFDQQTVGRVAIHDDGSPDVIDMISVDMPLLHPEGLRAIDRNNLVVTEDRFDQPSNGRLVQLALDHASGATTTVLASDLAGPTNVAVTNDSFWVTEGQITHLLDPSSGAPSLPFHVRRIPRN